MRGLPRQAKILVVLVYVAGALAGLAVYRFPTAYARTDGWELSLFLMLGVLAGAKPVRLMRNKGAPDVGSVSLGFALTFATLLRFGVCAAVVVGIFSTLFGGVFPLRSRQPPYLLAFYIALTVGETWLSSLLFVWANGGSLDLHPLRTFPAVLVFSVSCFLLNTGTTALLTARIADQPAFKLWQQTYLWTAPTYFAGACISTLAILVVGRDISAVLLFILPVVYLSYQSYAVYTARAEEKQQHIEALQLSHKQLADLYLSTIKSLALAIDAKDQYTHQHILRVQRYAVATAQQMNLTGPDLEGLSTGALLHDIGKLGVPEYVLLKPGRLSDEEFAKIKKHPEIGAAILGPVAFPWPVLPVVKSHHERWDGTGYPEGLSGEAIPLTARILAVADVYDALTSTRSYRGAWSHDKALALIRKESGTHFDPVVVAAFTEVIDAIVKEMAQEGCGPLAAGALVSTALTRKSDAAVRDIQRASSELWALYEVAQTLSSSLGLSEMLGILARKLEAILPGTACLFLLQEEGQTLATRACAGVNREFFEGCRTLSKDSTTLDVARTRQTFSGAYNPDDLLITGSETTPWVALHSALIVPIVHQNEVLGTINLYHPQADAFSAHDCQLLEMIAERAALAICNGLSFDRTRSHAAADPLTGLYNVRYLTQYVEQRCQKASAGAEPDPGSVLTREDSFTLLCLDMDSFKPINDNFGHHKGDDVLCALANLLREVAREGDVIARYGGDEFLIVLDRAGPREAEAMAQRLFEAVANYDPGLTHPKLGALRLEVSVGWAGFPLDGADCATLISAAYSQMHHNKSERKLGRLAPHTALASAAQTKTKKTLRLAA